MSTEIKVPALPESVADATVVAWHKQPGEAVARDEVLVDIETDKVVLEVPAPADGVLESIAEGDGATVVAEQLLGTIAAGAAAETGAATTAAADAATDDGAAGAGAASGAPQTSPAVRKLLEENGLSAADVAGSGKNGRITREDVQAHLASASAAAPAPTPTPAAAPAPAPAATPAAAATPAPPPMAAPTGGAIPLDDEQRPQKRVPMTRLRARIAERLLHAKNSTAMLTTFNELNMQPVMELRKRYKDQFEKSHDVRLGFMSFFVKAAAEALKRFPEVNASIDGSDIVYHGFCDVGIAVSSNRGLVVPILRNAENMSLAQIEKQIGNYAAQAREGRLSIEDMTGGTFTITNGGVFGSMLSTPILNPPQSAILGMHATKERPVVEDGQIVIRPVMYLALSYDHRIVDGSGAVTFLKTIKELLEDPARMLLDI